MNSEKKIFVVEDDELMIKILEFILKKEGYQVCTAKDGLEAIEKIPALQPDLIITDVMLPYKSGLEIISFVKKNYTIPIIVLSALGEEERTVVEAFKLGADDFIAKPFNPNELILRIKRLIVKKLL